MQYFQKKQVTPADLKVTHEAAQTKLEIQYLVSPLTGDWGKKDFFRFQKASNCKEGWPFTTAEACGNRNL